MAPTKPPKPIGRRTGIARETAAPAGSFELDEFLADEYVLDEDPEATSNVGFAGPSDAPPPPTAEPLDAGREIPSHLLVSPLERKELVRGFVLFVAFLAATVAAVFARTKNVWREPPEPSASRAMGPEMGAGSVGAVSGANTWNAGLGGASAVGGPSFEASEAKRLSQAALENGHPAEAIEAGEHSVALDPTDAESWLILGAGYDQAGQHTEALRCFARCVQSAEHGPRGECAALLR